MFAKRMMIAAAACLSLGGVAVAQSSGQATSAMLVGSWDCVVTGTGFETTAEFSYTDAGAWAMEAQMNGAAPTGEVLEVSLRGEGGWMASGANVQRDVVGITVNEFLVNGAPLPQEIVAQFEQSMGQETFNLNVVQLDASNLILESGDGSERETCVRK